jgi:small multidrug resistance pump
MSVMNPMLLLFLAIMSEVIATSALKASDGFTRLLPSLLVVLGYGSAFYLFSLSIRHLPLGVAYAIWSGVGTVGAALIGVLVWQEVLNAPRLLGMGLIIAGVLLLNLYTQPAVQ